MRSRLFLRLISLFTLFFFCCSLMPTPVLAAAEEGGGIGEWIKNIPTRFVRRIKKPEKKITSPEELEELFSQVKAKTFDDNAAQRDEKADWKRPASQVSLSLLDGQIGIIRQFLAFQAAGSITQTARLAGQSAAWQTAKQVVGKMAGDSAQVLNSTLARSSFGKNMFALLGSSGFKSALAREGNFVLMGLIIVLINSGIYDGLDVDTMKDHVVAIAPLCTDWTYDKGMPTTLMVEFLNRQLFAGFNGYFDKIYQSALNSKSIWGKALSGLDAKANALGRKLFKATRLGLQNTNEQTLANKLGLVGVGEGVQFTLGGLFQRLAVGGAFAIGGQFILDSTYALGRGFQNRTYLGGNRNKYWVGQDLNAYQYQKTGKKWKDAMRERYIRMRDVIHKRIKWPLKSFIVPVSGLVGGYFGSVLAGALFLSGGALTLVGGTLVSSLLAGLGTFVGTWAATKLDRSKFMMNLRRRNYVRRIKRELKETPLYREGKLTDSQIDEIAEARSYDFEKIEKVGQVSKRILFVDHASSIMLGKKGDYWKMVIEDEHGSEHEANADIRYDVIDIEGNRWIYDIHTNKVRNVGRVVDNNGRFIVFVNSTGVKVENDIIVNRGKDDPERTLHIFDNGVILERRGDEWIVRGQGADRDVFFRDTGERFEWREGAFRRAKGPGDTAPPAAPVGVDPLDIYTDTVTGATDEQLHAAIRNRSHNHLDALRRSVYADIENLDSLESVHGYLADVANMLGVAGDEAAAAPGGVMLGDIEMARTMLKGKVDRYLERAIEQVDAQLETVPADQLRAAFTAVQRDYPCTDRTMRHETIGSRMRNVEVWGLLSLLNDNDAVLAAALHGSTY